jgi:hypothetical protein
MNAKYQILECTQIIRNDSKGNGHFGSKRTHGKHQGVDILTSEGETIKAPHEGFTRLGWVSSSKPNQRLIEIRNGDTKTKIMYVIPTVKNGDYVEKGDKIGTAYPVKNDYSEGMLNHIHVESFKSGVLMDITKLLIA